MAELSNEATRVMARLGRTSCSLYTSEISRSTGLGRPETIVALEELQKRNLVEPASWRAVQPAGQREAA